MLAKNYEMYAHLAEAVMFAITLTISVNGQAVTEAVKQCDYPGDVVILLDESSSVKQEGFITMRNFAGQLARRFNISSDIVHLGVMTFSWRPNIRFHLNEGTSGSDVQEYIRVIAWRRGGTNTHEALRTLRQEMFSSGHGARSWVPKIAFIITDGKSRRPVDTIDQASLNHDAGIISYAIGVGNKTRTPEMEAMASLPLEDHEYAAKTFDDLFVLLDTLAENACRDLSGGRLTTTTSSATLQPMTVSSTVVTTAPPVVTTHIVEGCRAPNGDFRLLGEVWWSPDCHWKYTCQLSSDGFFGELCQIPFQCQSPGVCRNESGVFSCFTKCPVDRLGNVGEPIKEVDKASLVIDPTSSTTGKCVDDDGVQFEIGETWLNETCQLKHECSAVNSGEARRICALPFDCNPPAFCENVPGDTSGRKFNCYAWCQKFE